MTSPKVSIIIPCYNVEKYVRQCVESATHQSEKSIEIIAVDDGSTDSTSALLDDLARNDNRIVVIHKENSGVSDTRNVGLSHSNGEYVVFIDGDDYLSPDAISYYLSLVEDCGADFGLSLDCFTRKNETQSTRNDNQMLTSAQATALLLSHRVIVGCWNKIFKRDFIIKSDLRFNTSLFYGEGLRFITQASQRANKIAVGNRKVYYYRRNNEASATSQFNVSKMINGEKSLEYIKSDLQCNDPDVVTMLNLHICKFKMGIAVRIAESDSKQDYSEYYKESLRYVRGNFFKLLFKKNIPMYDKGLLVGCAISPKLMAILDRYRRKSIAEKSVS